MPYKHDVHFTEKFNIEQPPLHSPNSKVSAVALNTGLKFFVPPRLEALYRLLDDKFEMGTPTPTRAELDENKFTRELPDVEKDEIIRYWTPYSNIRSLMVGAKEIREEKTALALKANAAATKIREERGLDLLQLPDQLRAVTQIFAEQIFNGSIRLGTMDVDECLDNFGIRLLKHRIHYVKEFMNIHEQLLKVAARVEEYAESGATEMHLTDDARDILAKADETLRVLQDKKKKKKDKE